MDYALLLEVILIVINCISLAAFGVDKAQSKRGNWRVPESRLLVMAFFAPFGAFAGMLLFRHKTRKAKFLLVPAFLALQVFVMVYFPSVRSFLFGNILQVNGFL